MYCKYVGRSHVVCRDVVDSVIVDSGFSVPSSECPRIPVSL
jgi:hypothetical protein